MVKKLLILICPMIFLFSCNYVHNRKVINFADTEVETKKNMIADILNSCGIENAEIYGVAHQRYGDCEISKGLITESYTGNSFSPEGPPGAEGAVPPEYWNEPGNNYNRLNLTVNYDTAMKNTVNLDYISFLVILDETYKEEIPRVEEALKEVILNRQRADTLTVLVK